MPNTKWSKLNHLQLGRYAEYYAKMEFTSYGYDVYTSEVDDHGVDFIAKFDGDFYEVQVKAVRNNNYVFIRQDKLELDDKHIVCYIRFTDGQLPNVYIIPSTVWKKPNRLFVVKNYTEGQKSKPEYGINCNNSTLDLLEEYNINKRGL